MNDEEKAAVEVLQENGWIFLKEILIEKATPEGEKWPSYVLGGNYPMGVIRRPGVVNEGNLPPQQGLRTHPKRGRPKKDK